MSSEMELFKAMVSDVNLVTTAMDSIFLRGPNLLLIIVIFIDCYCYYLLQLGLLAILPIWG